MINLDPNDSEQKEKELNFGQFKQKTTDNKTTVFFRGRDTDLQIKQVLASFIKYLKGSFDKDEMIQKKNMVVTYPSYTSKRGLNDLYDACQIAGAQEVHLISESVATLMSYAYEQADNLKKLQKEKPKIVAFVDIGHSKSTITVA